MSKQRYFVEATLYTGQHLQSAEVEDLRIAETLLDDVLHRAMVEEAYIVDCDSGELVRGGRWPSASPIRQSPAAMWRRSLES